jgi:hypothetical protein
VQPLTTEHETTKPTARHSTAFAALLGLVVGAIIGALVTLGVVSVASDDDESEESDTVASSETSDDADEDVPAVEETEEPSYEPTATDFSIDLSVKERKCFGSAGCNVTYRVEPNYEGLQTPTGTWEITYEVRGIEDGPQVQTFTLTDDSFSFEPEITVQTRNADAEAKAKVTNVIEGY